MKNAGADGCFDYFFAISVSSAIYVFIVKYFGDLYSIATHFFCLHLDAVGKKRTCIFGMINTVINAEKPFAVEFFVHTPQMFAGFGNLFDKDNFPRCGLPGRGKEVEQRPDSQKTNPRL